MCRQDRGSLLLHTSGFRVQIPLDLEWWNRTSRASLQVSESRSLTFWLQKLRPCLSNQENCLDWQTVFLWSQQRKGLPPTPSSPLQRSPWRQPWAQPSTGSGDHSQSWLMTCFEDHHPFCLPWAVAISFFFFFFSLPDFFSNSRWLPSSWLSSSNFYRRSSYSSKNSVFAAPGLLTIQPGSPALPPTLSVPKVSIDDAKGIGLSRLWGSDGGAGEVFSSSSWRRLFVLKHADAH